jgi:hypothetical protein
MKKHIYQQNKTIKISEFLKSSNSKKRNTLTFKNNKSITLNNKSKLLQTKNIFKKLSILSSFYALNNTITTHLIYYNDSLSKRLIKESLNNIKICKSYSWPEIEINFKNIDLSYKIQKKILESINQKKMPQKVQYATEDMTRGLAKFISYRYQHKLPNATISNAFIKLWECLTLFDIIPKNTLDNTITKFNVFHICEAPGQMILACKYFTEHKRKNIKEYNWFANSLNPFNTNVKAKYGNVLKDEYGLIKSNPTKWLWGADNTGDITQINNLKWFRKHIRDNMPNLNLIIGDGGLGSHNEPLVLQKLDLAQVIAVLVCSVKGGSCIIKHFTPYMTNHPETLKATSFFISFLYLYYITFEEVSLFKPYSSDITSGEFYVISKGFKGINDEQLEKLYKTLAEFKVNNAVITKDLIPETFIMQVNGFIEIMSNYNKQGIEKSNLLLNCYKELYNETKKNEKNIEKMKKMKKMKKMLYCNNFLNEDKIEEILIPRYNKWIKLYQFN